MTIRDHILSQLEIDFEEALDQFIGTRSISNFSDRGFDLKIIETEVDNSTSLNVGLSIECSQDFVRL